MVADPGMRIAAPPPDPTAVQLRHLVGTQVWGIRPLLAGYFEVVSTDPWMNRREALLSWWETVSRRTTGIVLGGIVVRHDWPDKLVGFCAAEVQVDQTNRTRALMVYGAYVMPGYRSARLRDETLRALTGFARTHGATYIGTLAARGPALARWLGRGFRPLGRAEDHDYIAAPIPHAGGVG